MSKGEKEKESIKLSQVPGGTIIGVTIFLSALLLFLVQPMISKFILPWYGGSPAVWTTCMLFFQTLLLVGYAYAHFLTQRTSIRTQILIHGIIILIALTQLPPIPSAAWKLQAESQPILSILLMLGVTLGLPYIVLSATSPLLQNWFTSLAPKTSPYRLYALSNIGSLLALLSFPFLIEPFFTRQVQAWGWAVGMVVFSVCCGFVLLLLWKRRSENAKQVEEIHVASKSPSHLTITLWILFPAVSSLFLLATTNKLCQEVTVVPLLWIMPLALYLLSFVLAFDNPRWYSRRLFLGLFVGFLVLVILILMNTSQYTLPWIVVAFPGLLFTVSMLCHGEVMRLKPSPARLTTYYLSIAFGGVLGSLFVVIIAPLIFTDYSEYHIGLFSLIALMMVTFYTDHRSKLYKGRLRWAWIANILLVIAGMIAFVMIRERTSNNVIDQRRNFYGMIKIEEHILGNVGVTVRTMLNGHILHGSQFISRELSRLPTAYYSVESGLGRCFQFYPVPESLRIGAVGLGVGTVAAWTRPGDYLRIYEINPDVKMLADQYFHFLREAMGKVDYIQGDARLSLEREKPQQFDILVLDAFTNDSPPIHLLTVEAFDLYRKHLKSTGVIAVHISSRFINYYPLIASLTARENMGLRLIIDKNPGNDIHRLFSSWVLISSNRAFLDNGYIMNFSTLYPVGDTVKAWTDDYSSLYPLLKWAPSEE